MKEFLSCTPTVFAIGTEYEIVLNLNAFGICFLKIGDTLYYEENSGVLPSERTVLKIRVPQHALDAAKEYEVIFRETDERRRYWSVFFPPVSQKFAFKPLEKTDDIRLYYVSDVHGCFDQAKTAAAYWGEQTDLFVFNGDMAEPMAEQNYRRVLRFMGEVTGGRIPAICARGNHDTRGRLAEAYPDHFPANGKKTYYTFEVGPICGIVLDFGEDKLDTCKEYDSSKDTPTEYLGINRFHAYRQAELEFLKTVQPRGAKTFLVITHVCPAMVTQKIGGEFDIDRELYTACCRELDRIAPSLMLCGHYHTPFLVTSEDERNLNPHAYPIVMGANRVPTGDAHEHFGGTAIHLVGKTAKIAFTDESHTVCESFTLDI